MNTTIIRPIATGDFENLSALAIYVWLATYASSGIRDRISRFVLENFTPQKFRELKENKNIRIYVAIDDNHLVGFITLDLQSEYKDSPQYGYEIKTLYVHPSFQKRGIGKALINHCQKNCGSFFWLSTWFRNEGAIQFYQQLGFKRVGTTEFNLSGELHTNFVLAR